MTNICLYFQVHQPYRIKQYPLFDIGKHAPYFDEHKNAEIMRKVARKCYVPTTQLLLDLIHKHPSFCCSFSITGTALEQFEKYSPEVLEQFEKLAATGRVEFLSETYHHSLSFLYDAEEFDHQIALHKKAMKMHFGAKPTVFRNTELIYHNALAAHLEKAGYAAVLAEGWDGFLGWRSPDYVYKAAGTKNVKLLLKNYRLSDDIAFRFGNKSWNGYPLTADKYAGWIAPVMGDSINLFMDFETFGEHQWEDTGIFEFMKHLPFALDRHNIGFHLPSDAACAEPKDELDIHHPISWADTERDTSAWLGNQMQTSAIAKLYRLKKDVLATKNAHIIDSWRKLTTSDHFYYMCTKWFSDGDVHKYFNPHNSPYEAYISFMNVISDLEIAAKKKNPGMFTKLAKLLEVSA
ncbi:alpha-amylase [Candidatus Woesearchaeota archaeon]|nr:MAG: alpha-amylase [Candidatus Woesearchaeota archaeon]